MYGSYRQAELVGKRFLCVREKNSLRPNSRSSRVSNPLDYQWKVGVIRACSDKDVHHLELKVLVEYDKEDWTTREWLSIRDGNWKIFLVEKTMVWSQRPDPSNPRRPLLWPALTFFPLVDRHGLNEEDHPIPVEFVGDHERAFVRSDEFRPYAQDDDALQPALRNNPVVMEELRSWQRLQKSQSILLDGPFTLTGFRVKVYRQSCRQWFSAVITAHDIISRELSVMDDTVLQTHRVDPALIQVILLANEAELDCLLRGELVRVLPMRQHRHSQVIITAPLTAQTTTSSHPSVAPTSWQLYAGLTQAANSNSLVNSTQATYSPTVVPTSTRPTSSSSPSITQATSKARRRSSETRNRSSSSRRVTRSDSAGSPALSSDNHQQTPQTFPSSFTSASETSLPSQRTVTRASSELSNTASPEACSSSASNNLSSLPSMGSPSSSLQKKSPIKQPMSPKTSPTMLQYNSSPNSKAGMSSMGSPFRSNPFGSSPDMSSMVSMASPISGMSHMGMCSPGHVGHSRTQSPHHLYSHPLGHLNLSPNQLYALQLQQQQQQQQQQQMNSAEQQEFLAKWWHQHYQNLLHQYQMQCYQLQLILQQQELLQQMPLTPQQQNLLGEYYNQLLYQYQRAQNLQQLAASQFHPIDEQENAIRTLPERIQQKLRENQEQQKAELQNMMPRLQPEQLQTFYSCLQQQIMAPEQIKELYSLLIQQQQSQKRPPHANREQQEDEHQKPKIQQYLQQSQEQLQKFLQFPKSFSQEHDRQRQPNTETSTSSPQRDSPSSSSSSSVPLSSSSSSSSYTVHYHPPPSESTAVPNVKKKDRLKSEPNAGTSSSETSGQQENLGVEEIELKVTTTEEERSISPHSDVEKLLHDHQKAGKESKHEVTSKARKGRTSSTETKSKRQRKSTESSRTIMQTKESSGSENRIHTMKASLLLPDSSTENHISSSSTGNSSKVQKCAISVSQTSSESKEESFISKEEPPGNLVLSDSHTSDEVNQGKAEENKTKVPEQAPPLVREKSPLKATPKEPLGDIAVGAPPGNVISWGSETTQNNEPSSRSNIIMSMDGGSSEITAVVGNCSDNNILVRGVAAETTSILRNLLEKPSLGVLEKEGSAGSENVLGQGVTQQGPQTSALRSLGEKVSSNKERKSSKSKTTERVKDQVPLAATKGLKKPSAAATEKEVTTSQPSRVSKNSFSDASELSANITEENQVNNSQDVASNCMDVTDTPDVLRKVPLGPGTNQLTNCFSVFSSNSSNHDGELFSSKELKTYSKKVTPVKRKSSSNASSSVGDRSVVSKVLKIENSKSPEIDIKRLVEDNRKVELSQTLSNAQLNSQPEQTMFSAHDQLEMPLEEKSRKTRKKAINDIKVPSKKVKCDEDRGRESEDLIKDKSVKRLVFEETDDDVCNHVSFVADQAVEDVAVNHSPTAKDAPTDQCKDVQHISERQNRSKERIREMTNRKKELKAKLLKKKASVDLPALMKKEPANGESLESVVDSVLDEEIAVIYNGGEYQDNCDVKVSEIDQQDVVKNRVETARKTVKQRKKREPQTKDVVKRERKRRGKKCSESDGDTVSPTSEQYFLQDRVCAKFSHLPKCRDCRDVHDEKSRLEFCRFNMFRRLRKKKNGNILAAGFQLPEHAAKEDLWPWVSSDKGMMDKGTSLYILFNIGDQFCSVMQEEKKAITQAGENASVAYKRAVQGVREMCDVCTTTIFNIHWVCHRCGFGVCLDCYNLRVKEREEQPGGLGGKRVFEFKWSMCCPGICHQPKYLSVAQIIPKTVLSDLGDELHRAREVWDISKMCPCKGFVGSEDNESAAKITELCNDVMDATGENQNQNQNQDKVNDNKAETQEANDAAAASSSGNLGVLDSESSFDGSDDVNLICHESLGVESPANHEQEWLTEEKRRNHFTKKAGFGLVDAKPHRDKGVSHGLSLLMDYNSSTEGSPCESPAKSDMKSRASTFNFSVYRGLDLLVLACESKEGFPISCSQSLDQGNWKEEETTRSERQDKPSDKNITDVPFPVATPSESTSAESCDEVRRATPPVPDHSDTDACTDAPHSWLCDGRLLRLHDPRAPGNVKAFELRWKKGEPVLVSHVDKYLNLDIWTPKAFGQEFGSEIADVVNCRTGVVIEKFKVGDFWEGFESIKDRPLDSNGEPMLLKLKDWPPKDDFSEKLPTRFEDMMNNVPLPEYTRRDGSRNLVSRLPDFFVKPDLGPKMYNAYGSAACPKEGTTNLHLDMSDAVNIMVYVGVPRDQGAGEKERDDAIKAVDQACDESQRMRVRQETARIGALWHIYAAEDADKIRECLREITKERKMKHSQHHDPIHDQCFYLDHDIRQRLKKDYGVEGWAICQCLGDAVFIPAGAPHQVRNLYSCVKVAEDFVSPERIDHCFRMTQEFRHLSDKHTNHEDKLQVKNIIYHAVKDALSSLKHYEDEEKRKEEHKENDRVD